MTILQSILLGALQGVAEFLPVSSSGHLVLARQLMNIQDVPPLFDIFLHMATLIVIVVIFRKTIGRLLVVLGRFVARKNRSEDRGDLKLIAAVLIASFFTALLGGGISLLDVEKYPKVVSCLFLMTAAILLFSRKMKGNRGYADLKVKDGIITGLAQGIGVLPGISRSGITIAASMGVGMDRNKAGEYSFLLSIPAVVGALILELKDLGELSQVLAPSIVIAGVIAAMTIGFFSLILLMRLIKQGRLYLFAFYLIPLGLLGLFFL